MDAGCELFSHTSDVSRTWPVSGKFTPEQRALYSVVEATHKHCLASVKPGETMRKVHMESVNMLLQGIEDIGVLPSGQAANLLRTNAYGRLYPHAVGTRWDGLGGSWEALGRLLGFFGDSRGSLESSFWWSWGFLDWSGVV